MRSSISVYQNLRARRTSFSWLKFLIRRTKEAMTLLGRGAPLLWLFGHRLSHLLLWLVHLTADFHVIDHCPAELKRGGTDGTQCEFASDGVEGLSTERLLELANR